MPPKHTYEKDYNHQFWPSLHAEASAVHGQKFRLHTLSLEKKRKPADSKQTQTMMLGRHESVTDHLLINFRYSNKKIMLTTLENLTIKPI